MNSVETHSTQSAFHTRHKMIIVIKNLHLLFVLYLRYKLQINLTTKLYTFFGHRGFIRVAKTDQRVY